MLGQQTPAEPSLGAMAELSVQLLGQRATLCSDQRSAGNTKMHSLHSPLLHDRAYHGRHMLIKLGIARHYSDNVFRGASRGSQGVGQSLPRHSTVTIRFPGVDSHRRRGATQSHVEDADQDRVLSHGVRPRLNTMSYGLQLPGGLSTFGSVGRPQPGAGSQSSWQACGIGLTLPRRPGRC